MLSFDNFMCNNVDVNFKMEKRCCLNEYYLRHLSVLLIINIFCLFTKLPFLCYDTEEVFAVVIQFI